MKKLANLKGVKALNRNEQKSINGGGGVPCNNDSDCRHLGDCFVCTAIGVCFQFGFGGTC